MTSLVALVEDDPDTEERVCDLLRARGYRVEAYRKFDQAFESLADSPPDLLVTEIDLPGGSGLEFIARLRSFHSQDSFATLVLSRLDTESDILRAYAAGADDFLSKPFADDEFLAKCTVLLTRPRPRAEAAPPLSSGEEGLLFGRYLQLGTLGKGAYGTVYRAKDMKSGRVVALKILEEEKGRQEENRYRFLRETYALSTIKHPHVVSVLDLGSSEGHLHCAMDCIEGMSLSAVIRGRGAISEGELLSLLSPVASALSAVHEQNLVHRDLKPANIMLRQARVEDPVLIDFGLTKQNMDRGVTDPQIILGTAGYIPPEVYAGGDFRPCGDLFSLGMVARFALFGDPWFGLDAYEIMNRMLDEGRVHVPPMENEGLREVILRLLEPKPQDRFQTAAEVAAALTKLTAAAEPLGLGAEGEAERYYEPTRAVRRGPKGRADAAE
ncbi:MAG: protein kinase [Planctomycetes bacterium]|nr:protein kinase [Planctomycetota bacterium]